MVIKHTGHENKEGDHERQNVLMFMQILLIIAIEMYGNSESKSPFCTIYMLTSGTKKKE